MSAKLRWSTPNIDQEISLSDKAIVMAYAIGYYATESGEIISPRGKVLRGGTTKQGYLTFTPAAYPDGKRTCVLQHRFVAYCKFGPAVFANECVRHANDTPTDNRWANLLLGTHKQNAQDMPPEKRRQRSSGAGERIVELNRKLSPDSVRQMRQMRESNNTPYKKLAAMFGVTTMTAHRAVNKQSWSSL